MKYFAIIFSITVVNMENFVTCFSHAAIDFHHHSIVEPSFYHEKLKKRISTTKEPNGVHAERLLMKLKVDDEVFLLDLVLNKQLLTSGFFHRYQENGTDKIHRHVSEDVYLCEYHGKVRGKPNSWLALSTCDGVNGVIYDGSELHYVSNHKNSLDSNVNKLDSKHYFYSHSNLAAHNKTCGYKGANETDHHNHILRYKRDTNHTELIRGPYNANRESKYVELVLVVDNREYKELGENRKRVVQHCKTIGNIINGLYSPLNIFVALVGAVIWSERDEINISKNAEETLTNFLYYRREVLIKDHPNDNAQLLSKFNFDHGVVGKAFKGTICTYEYSGGVNTDHSSVIGLVATAVAHQIGHNFGMEHDTNECKCPDTRCIMTTSISAAAPTHWSSCSLNYLLLAFTHGMDYCLKNKPTSLFDSPVCGNGFVEPGEQCDCGLPEQCSNTCCNGTTCMLHANASCATGECCDLSTCIPKNAGVLCRSADYECDLPEYCTGQSEFCPPDVYKMDTEVCDNGKAYCYHGFCRTRTDQCRLLWGETGKSSDNECYRMNTKGTRHGNCGYNKFTKSFVKCHNDSILCGMLHCRHLNERLEFGMESVAILSKSYINSKGTIIPCSNAIVDLGINQIDPGLAPDGAPCGDGKMCVNQRCMAVESLRRVGVTCPNNCNNNGWCNNLGHCHCNDGYSPPFCKHPGPGGSEDSGPASDPDICQFVCIQSHPYDFVSDVFRSPAIRDITDMLRRSCENKTAEIDEQIKSVKEFYLGVSEKETICSVMKERLMKCFKPMADFMETCVKSTKYSEMPHFTIEVLDSVASYVCQTKGEKLIELLHPCLVTVGYERESKCLKSFKQKLSNIIENHDTITNVKIDICKSLETTKTCFLKEFKDTCKNDVTMNSAVGFYDAVITKPCKHARN